MLHWFDPNIKKVIELFSHPVWIVVRLEDIPCSCVDFTTKVPDQHCKHCFGLGSKLRLVKAKASNQNAFYMLRGTGLGSHEKGSVNTYYTYQFTGAKVGDIVLDHECLDIVSNVYYERSACSDVVYCRIETRPVKYNVKILRQHILNRLKETNQDVD